MCARVGVRESRRSMKRTRCRCSGRGMYNFFRAPASESGGVSRRVFSEITCWIACDLFHDGRRIPAIFSFPFSQLPSRSFTHKLDAYRERERERPFSLRYRRQSSRVSWEMSSSVSWWRGLSSGDRRIVSSVDMVSDSGQELTGCTPPLSFRDQWFRLTLFW